MLPDFNTLLHVLLVVMPLYMIGRYLWMKVFSRREEKTGTCLREYFLGVYVVAITTILVFTLNGEWGSVGEMTSYAMWRVETGYGMNFVPFHTIAGYYSYRTVNSSLFYANVVGNVLLFIPWGFGLVCFWKKNRKIGRFCVLTLILPIFIEAMQLFIGRQVDIDDVILNFAGAIIGALIWLLVRTMKVFKSLEI